MIKESINSAPFKAYTFIVSLYSAILIGSVLLDYKFIEIFGLTASTATFTISISFFILDIISEVYSSERAFKTLIGGVFSLMVMSLLCHATMHSDAPVKYANFGHAYSVILPSFAYASIINAGALIFGSALNIKILKEWRKKLKGKGLIRRCLFSSAAGELIYTVIVVTLLNYKVTSIADMMDIMIISYFYKFIFDLIACLVAVFIIKKLKRIENISVDCIKRDYTPRAFMEKKNEED